jgi:5-methylcytosine-specific restriction endonuclease McrA
MPVEVACGWCGSSLQFPPSVVRRNPMKFCDRACMGRWMSANRTGANSTLWNGGTVRSVCDRCGKETERPKSQAHRPFCGRECQRLWRIEHGENQGPNNPFWRGGKLALICDWCGSTFLRNRSAFQDRNFCNAKCMGKWASQHRVGEHNPRWKGGCIRYYGPNWNEQQRLARQRDKHICRVCGVRQKKIRRALSVHHIKPFREFSYIPGQNDNYMLANELTNLITLCERCHKRVEHGKVAIQLSLL